MFTLLKVRDIFAFMKELFDALLNPTLHKVSYQAILQQTTRKSIKRSSFSLCRIVLKQRCLAESEHTVLFAMIHSNNKCKNIPPLYDVALLGINNV